jgi:hypothetical protein
MDPIAAPLRTAPRYYTSLQIGVAALLGGPMAGGYFASQDHALFGLQKRATATLVVSAVVLVALLIVDFLLPEKASRTPVAFVAAYAYRWYAQAAFDSEISTRHSAGAVAYSWWRVIGISLAICLVTLLCILIGVLAWRHLST